MRLRNKLLSLVLVFAFVSPVLADDLDDAIAANNRGEFSTALPIFKRYAEQGDPESQYLIGVMFGRGLGVTQDYVQAYMWVSLAASSGNQLAIKFRDHLAEEMTPSQIEKAQELSGKKWAEINK